MKSKDLIKGEFYLVGTKRGPILCKFKGQTANGKKFAFVGNDYLAVFPGAWSELPTVSPVPKQILK